MVSRIFLNISGYISIDPENFCCFLGLWSRPSKRPAPAWAWRPGVIGAFEQMVAARLIEPTSKAGTPGALLSEIGWPGTAQHNTLQACLVRARERGYRESLSRVLFDHITATRGLALCLQV